jgi:hypothetical protein
MTTPGIEALLTTGSGRFPVRGYAPLLRRIMDDQGERTPERRTSDVQFHRNIRSHRHGSSGPSPVGASRSLQTLLSRQHVPALGAGVCMHPRTVAGPHDSVRENRGVARCCGKLQWSDDGDRLTSSRGSVRGPNSESHTRPSSSTTIPVALLAASAAFLLGNARKCQ